MLGQVSGHLRIPLMGRLDALFYDARLRLTAQGTIDPRVVIVDIDEKSLVERERGGEGRWPWPRDRMAVLLDKLFDHYHAAVVGFDVVFSERDESSGIRVLERLGERELNGVREFHSALRELKPQLDYDEIFGRSLAGRPVVLGYLFVNEHMEKGELPSPVLRAADLGNRSEFPRFSGYTANIPPLQRAAALQGHFNPLPDSDGITRRVPALVQYGANYYEPLWLAVVRLIYGAPAVKPLYSERSSGMNFGSLEGLLLGSYRIPVDHQGAVLVPYRGPRGKFAYYSAIDVLNGRIDMAKLGNKIVLVGATAPGMFDLRATPVDPVYPGVEIHANLVAGVLDQNIKYTPVYGAGVEFTIVLLLGCAMAVLLPRLSAYRAALGTLALLVALVISNVMLFQYAHMALSVAVLLTMVVLLFTFNMAYGFFVEARVKRQITGLFGQYVPPELVDEIAKHPGKFSMNGESRDMTVLFADVRGFTSIAEKLDARELSQLMNELLTPLTEVVYQHRGTIDKYMGDCVMAFWGAPLGDSKHAMNAVLASMEMQCTVEAMQRAFAMKRWPQIHIGIGVSTGRMSVGNMGSRLRRAYTVMGDAVNLASRLEGITKEYGVDIIVSEATKNAAPDMVFRQIDRVRVKGRDAAINIYQPVGLSGEISKATLNDIQLFHEALEAYHSRDWRRAELPLLELKRRAPLTRLYDVFLERIRRFRANAPSTDWGGIFAFESK
jgi:adenylate cyclase